MIRGTAPPLGGHPLSTLSDLVVQAAFSRDSVIRATARNP